MESIYLFYVAGGLTAVMNTDTLQTIIMTVGALALTGISKCVAALS